MEQIVCQLCSKSENVEETGYGQMCPTCFDQYMWEQYEADKWTCDRCKKKHEQRFDYCDFCEINMK